MNFNYATIGENLLCEGSQFVSESEEPALNADSIKIAGSAFFRSEMLVEGKVHFTGAYVGGDFHWWGVRSPQKSTLDLRFTKVDGTLFNSKDSWPSKGKLCVRGFIYDDFDDRASASADVQLDWLHRQAQDPFASQPYEQ